MGQLRVKMLIATQKYANDVELWECGLALIQAKHGKILVKDIGCHNCAARLSNLGRGGHFDGEG